MLFKGSAAAANPLEGQVPLVVDMTLRWVDMTLRDKILEGQKSGFLVVVSTWDPQNPIPQKKCYRMVPSKVKLGSIFFHDFLKSFLG